MNSGFKKVLSVMLVFALVLNSPICVSAEKADVENMIGTIGTAIPLKEYDDPIEYAQKYQSSFTAYTEAFLVNWGLSILITDKNDQWQMHDEQALMYMLMDESLINKYINGNRDNFLNTSAAVIKNISNALEESPAIKNLGSGIEITQILNSSTKDTLKTKLVSCEAKMEILSVIYSNTEDPNLRKACENCISTFYTNTINEIQEFIVSNIVASGIDMAKAVSSVPVDLISKSASAGLKEGLSFLGNVASGLSLALIILDIKDLVVYLTGMNKKIDAYMDIISSQEILYALQSEYQYAVELYEVNSSNYDKIESLFDLILRNRQYAYDNVPTMLGDSEWQKESSPPFSSLYSNWKEIQTISIENYGAEMHLTERDVTLKLGESYNIVYNISGPSNEISAFSDDESIAVVTVSPAPNNHLTIYPVKPGKTTITVNYCNLSYTIQVKVAVGASNWYESIINSSGGSYKVRYQFNQKVQKKTVKRKDFPYYCIKDINKDGTKELILSTYDTTKYPDNRVLLLTYYNGKVKPLICFEGAGSRGHVSTDKKQIIFETSGSDFYYRIIFKIKSGKLKKVQDIRYRKTASRDPRKRFKYYINGKSVSASKYDKAYKKHSNKKELTFS